MKGLRIICLWIGVAMPHTIWASHSPEVLGAACDYSVEHRKLPWACYHPKGRGFGKSWAAARLDRHCMKSAKISENVRSLDPQALRFLPKACLAQVQKTLRVIEYKKEDI